MKSATMQSASACVRHLLSGKDGPAQCPPLQLGMAAAVETRARGAKMFETFMVTEFDENVRGQRIERRKGAGIEQFKRAT